MSDRRDLPAEPDSDPMLEALFSPLKGLEPPWETRLSNRMAVAAELGALQSMNRQSRSPWWRRSISVPVPIAASFILLATLATCLSFRGWLPRSPVNVASLNQSTTDAAPRRADNSATEKRAPGGLAVTKCYSAETYLCGIGRVSSESHVVIEE